MLISEPRMVSIIGASRPLSSKDVPFCCPFQDPHLTLYRSNIGVQVFGMLDSCTSTINPS